MFWKYSYYWAVTICCLTTSEYHGIYKYSMKVSVLKWWYVQVQCLDLKKFHFSGWYYLQPSRFAFYKGGCLVLYISLPLVCWWPFHVQPAHIICPNFCLCCLLSWPEDGVSCSEIVDSIYQTTWAYKVDSHLLGLFLSKYTSNLWINIKVSHRFWNMSVSE